MAENTDKDKADPRPRAHAPAPNAWPPFAALRAFDAVAREGGVRKAAEALGVDHAVVSRHLRTIEAWTGAALFERTRTGLTLTEVGEAYAGKLARALDALADASQELLRQADDTRLQIWSVPGFAFRWLMPHLRAFQDANLPLRVELRPTEAGPDFSRHEADIDIRYAPDYGAALTLPANVRAVNIDTPAVIAVASPAYLAKAAPVKRLEDLLEHPLMHEEDFENWRAWFAAHGVRDAAAVTGQRFWQAHLAIEAARHGGGVVLANRFLVGDDLRAGALAAVCGEDGPFAPVTLGSYMLIARADRWNDAPVARFRNWLLACAAVTC